MSSPSIRRDKGAKHMSAQVNHASVSDPFELPVPPPQRPRVWNQSAEATPTPLSLSVFSLSLRRAQEVAERSQRQLGVVAVIGALVPLLIVLVVLVFHFTVGSAVTGSCVIEEEKHIAHEYRMVSEMGGPRVPQRLSDLPFSPTLSVFAGPPPRGPEASERPHLDQADAPLVAAPGHDGGHAAEERPA